MAEKVVVAGAGFAGINCALDLAGKGYDVELIDRNGYHLFTPGIPDFIGDKVVEDKLSLDLAEFFSGVPVEFIRENIVGFSPEDNVVETTGGGHSYDHLVVALGYDVDSFGLDLSDVHTAYHLEDSKRLKEEIQDSEDALVVGAGYVGVEVAAELEQRGLDVTVLDQVTRPMPDSSSKVSEIVLDYFSSAGISFKGGKAAESLEKDAVGLVDGSRLQADTVIWVGGMQASKLVQRDFNCGKSGIDVNRGLSSSEFENVFAAGPCADVECSMTAHYSMEHADVISENIGKGRNESLEEFESGKRMLVLKMGDRGIFEYGDRSFESFIFRYLKVLIRYRHWISLRWKSFKLRFSAQ